MRFCNVLCMVACLISPLAQAACPATADDGETCRIAKAPGFMVFEAEREQWLDPDRFLALRKQRTGASTWGMSQQFPLYEKVGELDTFTAITRRGPCDMVFFHNRWRRQADVWEWGEEMKIWRGCAVVFE